MEIIPIDKVVSVSGEIQGHPATNLLQNEISPSKSWLCEKGSVKCSIILQLKRAAILTSVHIGNSHSAFVEVLVGKAADVDKFESLVPVSVFMTNHDSATGNNKNRTRLFGKDDFTESAIGKAWDRIKVVCSQPFNKQVPFGLCFIKIQGEEEKKAALTMLPEKKNESEIQIGSFFKKRKSSESTQQDAGNIKVLKKETKPTTVTPGSSNIERLKAKLLKDKVTENKDQVKTNEPKPTSNEMDEKLKKDNGLSKRASRGEEKTKKAKKQDVPKDKKILRKPFEKLLDDVVFVISGFQNPLRGNIRSLGLAMGARYSPDWDERCTHLVCACENTPKYNQVRGRGKIIRKDWLEKCHADRKRYPWRRFALNKRDAQQDESEEEIEEEIEQSDEEEGESNIKFETSMTKKKSTAKASETPAKTESSKNEEYDLLTDEDETTGMVDTSDYPMPYLPDLLSLKIFYVDPNLKSKSTFERYITAYNGIVSDIFNENVDYYVTNTGGATLSMIREKVPNIVAVKPSWLREINLEQKCTSTTPHLVN